MGEKPLFNQERHAHKIRLLDSLEKAYKSGDLDTVRDLVAAKKDKRSPNMLLDKDFDELITDAHQAGSAQKAPGALTPKVWQGNTSDLVDEVFDDMKKHYLAQPNRAGLDEKGSDYITHRDCPEATDEHPHPGMG